MLKKDSTFLRDPVIDGSDSPRSVSKVVQGGKPGSRSHLKVEVPVRYVVPQNAAATLQVVGKTDPLLKQRCRSICVPVGSLNRSTIISKQHGVCCLEMALFLFQSAAPVLAV
jgi:hypothetical protein